MEVLACGNRAARVDLVQSDGDLAELALPNIAAVKHGLGCLELGGSSWIGFGWRLDETASEGFDATL